MDQTSTSATSRCGGRDTLFAVVTSFKVWMVIYFTLSILLDLFSWAIPLILLGTIGVFVALNKFRVPPASPETVTAFFGSDFRPTKSDSESFSTVRSRLQSSPSSNEQSESQGHAMTIVGHRGAGLDAPENSISAFRLCKARGCTSIEFDVSMTKDNVAVVFHDDNILRITGIDREISDMTWEEVRQLDISVLHPLGEKFRGEKVPSFEEAVNTCLSLGLKFFIDLKDSEERTVEVILETFKKYPAMYNLAAVSSFSAKVVYLIRRQDPNIIGCMAWRPCYHRYISWNGNWENLELRSNSIFGTQINMIWDFFDELAIQNLYWWFLGLSAYLMQKDCITKEASYRWMKKGVRLILWTVNSPLEKLHLIQNVHLGYMTDTLDAGDLTTSSALPNNSSIAASHHQQPSSKLGLGIGDDSTN